MLGVRIPPPMFRDSNSMVEYLPSKQNVAGSSPVYRINTEITMKNIYNLGPAYSYRWKSYFIETLDIPEKSVLGEVACYNGSLHSMFDVDEIKEYWIIDGPPTSIETDHSYKLIVSNEEPTIAVKKIPDETFDFLYIDKFYNYLDALILLGEYFKKIRPGGWLAGSKYSYDENSGNYPVTVAINDFAKAQQENGTGKLDTRWIRFQEKNLPVLTDGEWRIKKIDPNDP